MDAISKNPKLLVRKEESQLCDQVYIYGVFFFFLILRLFDICPQVKNASQL